MQDILRVKVVLSISQGMEAIFIFLSGYHTQLSAVKYTMIYMKFIVIILKVLTQQLLRMAYLTTGFGFGKKLHFIHRVIITFM